MSEHAPTFVGTTGIESLEVASIFHVRDSGGVYFLFAGLMDAPLGGMDDYRGGFDAIADAKAYVAALGYAWAQIACLIDSDMVTPYGLRIVERYDRVNGWQEVIE